jgi:hypothetical protein
LRRQRTTAFDARRQLTSASACRVVAGALARSMGRSKKCALTDFHQIRVGPPTAAPDCRRRRVAPYPAPLYSIAQRCRASPSVDDAAHCRQSPARAGAAFMGGRLAGEALRGRFLTSSRAPRFGPADTIGATEALCAGRHSWRLFEPADRPVQRAARVARGVTIEMGLRADRHVASPTLPESPG